MALVLLSALALPGCKSSGASVVVHRGEIKTIESCKTRVENVFQNEERAFAALAVACGGPTGPNWWGTGKEPLGFAISTGDCALFGTRFYCATKLDVGNSVTLEPTYRFEGGSVLTREP